ncbi:MAG: hypothetical protein ACQGVK_05890 [Myxococcota bacterium]
MVRTLRLALCLLAVGATTAGCQKIEEPYGGEFEVSTVRLRDSIPADFGRLVGTNTSGDGWTQLVFERADGAVVVVSLNRDQQFISDRVLVIPRS